jgi:hypothetical protein
VWGKGGMWGAPGAGDYVSMQNSTHDSLHPHIRSNGNHMEDITSIAGNVWGPAGGPHNASAQVQLSCSAANYAAALRSAGAQAQSYSPQAARSLTNDVIHAHLDACGREVHALLAPPLLEAVCDAVRRAAPRLNAPALLQVSMGMHHPMNTAAMPGGPIGPVDVAAEFLACVNAIALSRPAVTALLERASDAAKRALVIAGLPHGTLPIGTPASTLAALKPMV